MQQWDAGVAVRMSGRVGRCGCEVPECEHLQVGGRVLALCQGGGPALVAGRVLPLQIPLAGLHVCMPALRVPVSL